MIEVENNADLFISNSVEHIISCVEFDHEFDHCNLWCMYIYMAVLCLFLRSTFPFMLGCLRQSILDSLAVSLFKGTVPCMSTTSTWADDTSQFLHHATNTLRNQMRKAVCWPFSWWQNFVNSWSECDTMTRACTIATILPMTPVLWPLFATEWKLACCSLAEACCWPAGQVLDCVVRFSLQPGWPGCRWAAQIHCCLCCCQVSLTFLSNASKGYCWLPSTVCFGCGC